MLNRCSESAAAYKPPNSQHRNPVDESDVMIGATAAVHDQPVVTRNVDHFERIEGVPVVEY